MRPPLPTPLVLAAVAVLSISGCAGGKAAPRTNPTPCDPGGAACPAGQGCLPGASGSTCGAEAGAPAVSALAAVRGTDGHVAISFDAADPDPDAVGASATFLDGGGAALGAAIPLAVGTVYGKSSFSFSGDLGTSASAVKVRVAVTDTAGGTGTAEATIQASSGGGGDPCVPGTTVCTGGQGCLPGASGPTCGPETGAPSVSALTAARGTDGHVTVSFTAGDPDKDALGATATFLDAGGGALGAAVPLAVGAVFGETSFSFTGDAGTSDPAAKLRVTVADTAGGTGSADATITTSGGGGGPTTVPAGNVSGHWTLAGSPYLVTGDITVAKGSTLTIDPGVQVVFQGQYRFRLYGGVSWVGTAATHIVFTTTAADVAKGASWVGWRGVRIAGDNGGGGIDHGPGIFHVEYCEFLYVDKSGFTIVDPYEDNAGSFYMNGFYFEDVLFAHNVIAHGRTSMIRVSSRLQNSNKGTTDAYFDDIAFSDHGPPPGGGASPGYAVIDAAHNPYGGSEPNNDVKVHFRGGSMTGNSLASTYYLVDTVDGPIYLDGVAITPAPSGSWYLSENPSLGSAVIYTPP